MEDCRTWRECRRWEVKKVEVVVVVRSDSAVMGRWVGVEADAVSHTTSIDDTDLLPGGCEGCSLLASGRVVGKRGLLNKVSKVLTRWPTVFHTEWVENTAREVVTSLPIALFGGLTSVGGVAREVGGLGED